MQKDHLTFDSSIRKLICKIHFLILLTKFFKTLFILNFKICPALKNKLYLKLLSRIFSFGGWITVVNIGNPILTYIDRFLICVILSIGVLAYYTAPFEAVQRLWIIPANLVITLFPAFSLLGEREAMAIVCLVDFN
ncbi:MAG: oligosaccharide flippase family protein [Candidatus Kryptonium sp.]